MHEQAGQDRDEVHAQFLSQVSRVVHVQDLSCHQEHNPEGEVPAQFQDGRLDCARTLKKTPALISFCISQIIRKMRDSFKNNYVLEASFPPKSISAEIGWIRAP